MYIHTYVHTFIHTYIKNVENVIKKLKLSALVVALLPDRLIYVYILQFYNYIPFYKPEWDSNPQPHAYHAHALTTELSGQTMRCA